MQKRRLAMESHFQRPVLTARRLLPLPCRAPRSFPQPTSGRHGKRDWHAQPLPRSQDLAGRHPAMATAAGILPGAAGHPRARPRLMGAPHRLALVPRSPVGRSKAPAYGTAQAAQRADGQTQVRHRFTAGGGLSSVRALIRRRTTSRMRWTICSSDQTITATTWTTFARTSRTGLRGHRLVPAVSRLDRGGLGHLLRRP